jgi:molybdenum cofactor guanylyltransferase
LIDASLATLAILAGGRSSRMGTPKSHLMIQGRPILARLLDRIAWPGPTLLVTSPATVHPPAAERFTREVSDPVVNEGPVRGLLTALESIDTPLLVVTTVDMPLVAAAQLHWLLAQLTARPELGLMTRTTDIQPFPSAFRREALPHVAHHLFSHYRSVHSLTRHPQFAAIDAPPHWPPDAFLNLNTPVEFDAFIRTLPPLQNLSRAVR